jgi:hypothetical protein
VENQKAAWTTYIAVTIMKEVGTVLAIFCPIF